MGMFVKLAVGLAFVAAVAVAATKAAVAVGTALYAVGGPLAGLVAAVFALAVASASGAIAIGVLDWWFHR